MFPDWLVSAQNLLHGFVSKPQQHPLNEILRPPTRKDILFDIILVAALLAPIYCTLLKDVYVKYVRQNLPNRRRRESAGEEEPESEVSLLKDVLYNYEEKDRQSDKCQK